MNTKIIQISTVSASITSTHDGRGISTPTYIIALSSDGRIFQKIVAGPGEITKWDEIGTPDLTGT